MALPTLISHNLLLLHYTKNKMQQHKAHHQPPDIPPSNLLPLPLLLNPTSALLLLSSLIYSMVHEMNHHNHLSEQ